MRFRTLFSVAIFLMIGVAMTLGVSAQPSPERSEPQAAQLQAQRELSDKQAVQLRSVGAELEAERKRGGELEDQLHSVGAELAAERTRAGQLEAQLRSVGAELKAARERLK